LSTAREKLEKLLALANDKSNSFESAMAYKMYLKLQATLPKAEAIKKANEEAEKEWNAYDESTWSEDERREYDYWRGGKFAFERTEKFLNEVYKVEGGYLVRRWNYLNAMSFHYMLQLRSFGNEYEGVRKNCLKQIAFFEQLQEDEFGQDEYDKHDQPWYTDVQGTIQFKRFQGQDIKKVGNPKLNYLMFIEEDLITLLESYYPKDSFKNAKYFESNAVAKLEV
jgi:hypothetical protein